RMDGGSHWVPPEMDSKGSLGGCADLFLRDGPARAVGCFFPKTDGFFPGFRDRLFRRLSAFVVSFGPMVAQFLDRTARPPFLRPLFDPSLCPQSAQQVCARFLFTRPPGRNSPLCLSA